MRTYKISSLVLLLLIVVSPKLLAQNNPPPLLAGETQEWLNKLRARIEGTDDASAANAKVLDDTIRDLESQYMSNRRELNAVRLPDGNLPMSAKCKKLARRQRVIAAQLVELDYRKALGFDITALAAATNRQQAAAGNGKLRVALMRLVAPQMHRRIQRKSTAEIVERLVGQSGADTSRQHPDATNGAIQLHRGRIRQILALTWIEDRLMLDRKRWDDESLVEDRQSMPADVNKLLANRGYDFFDPDATLDARNPLARMLVRQHVVPNRQSSSLQQLLAAFADVSRGQSSTGGGNRSTSWFHGENFFVQVDAELGVHPFGKFDFLMVEQDRRGAMFRFRTDEHGGVDIRSFGDVDFVFQQSADGQVVVTEYMGTEVTHLTADNFATLYREHSEFCQQRLLPFWDHLGIRLPLLPSDNRVMVRVATQLAVMANVSPTTVAQLITDLDGPTAEVRESATNQLRENLSYFQSDLEAALKGKLSLEQRMRITRLLGTAKGDFVQQLIVELSLLEDTDYLQWLIDQPLMQEHKQILEQRVSALAAQN